MKKPFHAGLVGIALITGSLHISLFFQKIAEFYGAPEWAGIITQIIIFALLLRKTVYKTEFRYKD